MGIIFSRTFTNLIEDAVLRFARIIDSISRKINRGLSAVSSFFFSRIFGYDLVFADDAARAEPVICGPGNVCMIPASKLHMRQEDKRRKSERRKRAEAAALGRDMVRHGETTRPNSPIDEKAAVMQSLGPVALAPPARPAHERETVAERDRGKLWVMGNINPSSKQAEHSLARAESRKGKEQDRMIDEKVVQRMMDQRETANTVLIKKAIQPRKSSKSAPFFAGAVSSASISSDPIAEETQTHADARFDAGHLTARKDGPVLAQPTPMRMPAGALSLVPAPLEGPFRHPFAPPIPAPALTSKAKQELRRQQRPMLSLDTHPEVSPFPDSDVAFTSSPTVLEMEDQVSMEPLSISRPPSGAEIRSKTPLGRKSMDAISLRSFRSDSVDTPIDVKMLANKAVKEGRQCRGWKDEVNKAAMQRCLQNQQNEQLRRLSAASLGPQFHTGSSSLGPSVGGLDKALFRVKTQEGIRRGSSPGIPTSRTVSGRSTPVLRAESPLHAVRY
ncbi:hypothetical protein BCV70DRAFT_213495 [Testicularia cyperi]|uniref:Uncharacterized protein n=1 Tax=Testicularia cyperi TaxID=1882483 RepID=A0A317XHV0_9BASI|nr:hypothetical protein BCV70DRAFT_213495 [Testicularia cyperi]